MGPVLRGITPFQEVVGAADEGDAPVPELDEAAHERPLQPFEVDVDPVDPTRSGGPPDGNEGEPQCPETFDAKIVQEHFEQDDPVRPPLVD